MTQVKTCHICGETKPLHKFIRDRNRKLGYKGPCKRCRRERDRKRFAKNPNKPTTEPKECYNCGKTKPASQFSRNRRSPDGLHYWCKKCANQYLKEYRAKQPDYQPSTKPKTCNQCGETKSASEFWEHKGHVDGLATSCKQCSRLNDRKRYHENPKRKIENNRRWRQGNLDIWNAMNQRRRARKEQVPGEYTPEDIEIILAEQKGRCVYCGIGILDDYTVDHIIPLSRSGSTNWPNNIQLLCRSCNSSKNDKTHKEYMAYLEEQNDN